MAEHGYLVISDISGYAKFLRDTELDHARESLSDLLNLLVEQTRSPLRIVELEGDAVFSYAPADEVPSPGVLTAMVEDCYVAFRRALNLMVINTSCTCKACRLLPTLDLKFFVHFGSYARQQVGDHLKLLGNDVNMIHRLLKNSVTETTGFKAYGAYTESAVEQLRLDRAVEGFVAHVETYDDLGQVEMCVNDMHGVWERARDKVRVRVSEEQAVDVREAHFSLPPGELWSYITDPVTRSVFMNSDWQKLEAPAGGGVGRGATFVCAHGRARLLQTIVDWEPPKSYTIRGTVPFPRAIVLATIELVPEGDGSRLRMISGPAQGPFLLRKLTDLITTMAGPNAFEKGVHALKQRIRLDRDESASPGSEDRGA